MRFKMRQNPPDDRRVLDAGNDLHRPAAALASLDIDAKHALESLRPGHGPGAALALPMSNPERKLIEKKLAGLNR